MKAIWINTADRTVTEVEYSGLRDLQRMVGGLICHAGYHKGDTVFVNDEGLFKFNVFFELPGCGQGLFAGPGVIVGKEIGDTANTRDPKSTLAEVTSAVKWLDRNQARIRSRELDI